MIGPSDVSAVLVTRGDVDLAPIIDSLAGFADVNVWDNSRESADVAVYGRYAVLERCSRNVVVVQDDDVLLPPESLRALLAAYEPAMLVANMPQRFRHDFYADHCLVGFGAIFDRDLPQRAFERMLIRGFVTARRRPQPRGALVTLLPVLNHIDGELFERTCDIVFTALTPRKLLDLPYADREFASAPNRMWRQPDHMEERSRMLDLVRKVAA